MTPTIKAELPDRILFKPHFETGHSELVVPIPCDEALALRNIMHGEENKYLLLFKNEELLCGALALIKEGEEVEMPSNAVIGGIDGPVQLHLHRLQQALKAKAKEVKSQPAE